MTDAELLALADDLTDEDNTMYIYGKLVELRNKMQKRLAELETQLGAAQKWVPPTSYETGALSVGDKIYVEVPGWGGKEEDEAWACLDEPAAEPPRVGKE